MKIQIAQLLKIKFEVARLITSNKGISDALRILRKCGCLAVVIVVLSSWSSTLAIPFIRLSRHFSTLKLLISIQ